MKNFLSKSRFFIIVPVIFLFFASVAAFLWGGYKTVKVVYYLAMSVTGEGNGHEAVGLVAIMDTFLIATALYIFALGLYELFIEDLEFPEWLVIHDLHSLKAKLASVIILVMAVTFLEHLAEWHNAWETLQFGAAIALVTAALIAFGYLSSKD